MRGGGKKDPMKIGISSFVYHRRSFRNFMESAARLGYESVELNCVPNYYNHVNALQLADNPALIQHVTEEARRLHLDFSALDCHGLGFAHEDQRRYIEGYLEAGIRIAEQLRCPVVITSSPRVKASWPPDAYWKELVTVYRRVCRTASARGVRVAVEVEKDFLVGDSPSAQRLLNDVDHEALGINFDPTHFFGAGEDPLQVLDTFYDVIAHVHVKDALGDPYRPIPFTGSDGVVAAPLVRELRRRHYPGVASMETPLLLNEDPDEVAEKMMTAVQGVLGEK